MECRKVTLSSLSEMNCEFGFNEIFLSFVFKQSGRFEPIRRVRIDSEELGLVRLSHRNSDKQFPRDRIRQIGWIDPQSRGIEWIRLLGLSVKGGRGFWVSVHGIRGHSAIISSFGLHGKNWRSRANTTLEVW